MDGKWGRGEREQIHSAVTAPTPLWAAGTYSCWKALGDRKELVPQSYPPPRQGSRGVYPPIPAFPDGGSSPGGGRRLTAQVILAAAGNQRKPSGKELQVLAGQSSMHQGDKDGGLRLKHPQHLLYCIAFQCFFMQIHKQLWIYSSITPFPFAKKKKKQTIYSYIPRFFYLNIQILPH